MIPLCEFEYLRYRFFHLPFLSWWWHWHTTLLRTEHKNSISQDLYGTRTSCQPYHPTQVQRRTPQCPNISQDSESIFTASGCVILCTLGRWSIKILSLFLFVTIFYGEIILKKLFIVSNDATKWIQSPQSYCRHVEK